jgi:hypothetical protein
VAELHEYASRLISELCQHGGLILVDDIAQGRSSGTGTLSPSPPPFRPPANAAKAEDFSGPKKRVCARFFDGLAGLKRLPRIKRRKRRPRAALRFVIAHPSGGGSPASPERNARSRGGYRGVGARPAQGIFLVQDRHR